MIDDGLNDTIDPKYIEELKSEQKKKKMHIDACFHRRSCLPVRLNDVLMTYDFLSNFLIRNCLPK
jgi:hypothetical protein